LLITSYQDLKVWQLAMDLAFDCYKVTRAFPRDELYGMTSQIRRASSSIAANIAEGHGRENTGSFIQFLRIGQGSLKELETYLVLATRLEFIDAKQSKELLGVTEEIGKMIRSMIRRLQEKTA